MLQPKRGLVYQLTDYLEQFGRRHRAEVVPPIDFWTAAAAHARPADLNALGKAAWERGLYRDAAQLDKNATAQGDCQAALTLINRLHILDPADLRPKNWAAKHTNIDQPATVSVLLDTLYKMVAFDQVAVLAERAAEHTSIENPATISKLLDELHRAGAVEQAVVLAKRVVERNNFDYPATISKLSSLLREIRNGNAAQAYAQRLSAAGRFDDFIGIGDHGKQFQFGIEPDGSPAQPWTWDDLV
jgi:hypothetical protein